MEGEGDRVEELFGSGGSGAGNVGLTFTVHQS
jgi:hypothetical protein